MAKIRIVGDSSGYVEIAAPSAAGNNTLELPSGNTRLVGSDSAGNVSISGIATFTNGPVLIGSGTSTGTTSQPLQVNGGAYFNGLVGMGTTNPTVSLQLSPNSTISNVGTGITLRNTVGSAFTVGQFTHSTGDNINHIRFKAARFSTGSSWLTASTKIVNVTDVTEQGYVEFNPNGALSGLAFGTGNTEIMRMDGSGRITTPYQPIFLAYGNTSQTLNTTATQVKVEFTATPDINVGSYFDAPNSNFNVPVSGKYFVFSTVMLNSNFTNYTYLFMDFGVNGNRLGREIMLPRPGGGDFVSIQGSIIINASAGDTIQVYLIQSGGTAGAGIRNAYRFFGGHLIG